MHGIDKKPPKEIGGSFKEMPGLAVQKPMTDSSAPKAIPGLLNPRQ